ncbi:hypothetical protein GC197_05435 [bacterium]|nr:hypothetical protein [bacterium]
MAKAKTTTRKTATKSTAKTSTKTRATKSTKTKVGDQEVTMDRRRSDRRSKAAADNKTEKKDEVKAKAQDVVAAEENQESAAPKMERRAKVNRRRQIDPTTCERDYTGDEIEFMQALDAYKRTSGRMFPTCSEILEVIRELGYSRGGSTMTESTEEAETPAEPPAFSDDVPAINQ